jgi:hypothetical protein
MATPKKPATPAKKAAPRKRAAKPVGVRAKNGGKGKGKPDISDALVIRETPKTTPASLFRAWAARPGAMGELCAFIVSKGASGHLSAFCKEHGFAYQTVLDWIDKDKDRAGMYARAREDRSDTLAEQLVSLTEDADVMTPILAENGEGKMVVVGQCVDKGKVQLLKIKADNLKWVASKLKPKVYGDKLDLTAKIDTNGLTDEELARKLASFGIPVASIAAANTGGVGGNR